MPHDTVTVNCPRCEEGELEFDLGYAPADPNYGSDADGNRGRYVPAYFYVESDCPEACSAGCLLTTEEEKEAVKAADEAARDHRPDEWEPDYDDRY